MENRYSHANQEANENSRILENEQSIQEESKHKDSNYEESKLLVSDVVQTETK